MSTQKRKLGYWGIDFLLGEAHSFDRNLFCRFLTYIDSLSDIDKLFDDKKNHKAVSLDRITSETKQGLHLYKIIFKSCKYNHSPDYMSSNDGSERPSDKKLFEGDKQLTHMCIRVDVNEAFTVFEERRNGVSMFGVISYFNKYFLTFLENEGYDANLILWASIIPPDEFLKSLNAADRISVADIYVEKKVLGSGYLDIMDIDASSQDDLTIALKAKRKESLPKTAIKKAFLAIASEGTTVKRIRLYGKDINKMNLIIDSLNGKRVSEVVVNLTDSGVVDSYSIFSKIEEVMGVSE